MYENITKISDLLPTFFSGILQDKLDENQTIKKSWVQILQSISVTTEKLIDHTKIIELKNETLYIETDHPGWIQLVQLNKNKIKKQLKKSYPELKINSFSFIIQNKNKKIENSNLENLTIEEKEKWIHRFDVK